MANQNTVSVFGAIRIIREAEAVHAVNRSAEVRIPGMEARENDRLARDRLRTIAACVDDRLAAISELARSRQITPSRQIVLAEGDPPVPFDERCLRIGVYPLAADPLHWGHILVGLTAMASMALDKVVYVIAGTDSRKPTMSPADARHWIGRAVIEGFRPLFEYSSLALANDLDGETNFQRLFMLNPHQHMEAFYIAGADHHRRNTARGEPDTIRKLERVAEEETRAGRAHHAISAVFVEREGVRRQAEEVWTSLRVHVLPPPVPFAMSSSEVRRALRQEASSGALVSLPQTYLREIRASGLYAERE